MHPSKIKPGTKLKIHPVFNSGADAVAFFVKRIPAQCGCKAVNYLRFPDYAGLDGPDDDGTCQMSDYELSRRGEFA